MQDQVAGEMIGIWDAWRAYEKRTGKPFRFYRAYPLVGRGSVEHDPYTHEECETMFGETCRISVLRQLKWRIDRVVSRHIKEINMKAIIASTISVFCTLLVGCMAPKQFEYKIEEQGARRCGTQFDKVLITVKPMTDGRSDKTSTEGWSCLAFLPLVPCIPYHNYDLEHYSADTGKLKFNTTMDLNAAVIEHLKYDGVADISSVAVASPDQRQYVLEVKIITLGIDGYRTLYCLGIFPGCYVAILGVPFSYSTSNLCLNFDLKNPDGKRILNKSYSASRKYCVGEYYNWNLFKQVGFNLADIMNRACVDIAQAIAGDYPDVQLTQRAYAPVIRETHIKANKGKASRRQKIIH